MPEEVRLAVNEHGRQLLDVEHAAVRARIALQGGHIVCTQSGALQPGGEVDRVYFDTDAEMQLSDGAGPPLLVQRGGSESVVIWNPWIDKSKRLSQFPVDGYRGMVCIEAANAGPDARVLQPGQCHVLSTTISRPGVAH